MVATIQVRVEEKTATDFLRSLMHNLDQLEAERVLEWIRDHENNFHTRIHYGQVPVVLTTCEEDGARRFHSLMIQAVTQPLEPDNADYLITMVSRTDLGDDAAIADELVERLERQVSGEAHDLGRILEKFICEN